jgi:hypothetical protein
VRLHNKKVSTQKARAILFFLDYIDDLRTLDMYGFQKTQASTQILTTIKIKNTSKL